MRLRPTAILVALMLAACGAQTQTLVATEPKAEAKPAEHAATAPVEAEPPAKEERRVDLSHAVGDYLVRRFTLRSRKTPTVLTERVIAVKEGSLVLEVTREAGTTSRSIRVELGTEPENRGEGASVLRVRGGKEIVMGRAAYEAILRDTVFVADGNDGEIDSAKVKLDVQGRSLDGTETRFRVKVGGRDGTMRT